MAKLEKEFRILEIMEATRVTRAEAEFIYSQESGLIDSDAVILIDPPVGPYSAANDIQAWLAELRGCPRTRDVEMAIQQAEAWLDQADLQPD